MRLFFFPLVLCLVSHRASYPSPSCSVGVDEELEDAANKGFARKTRGFFSRRWQGMDKEYIKPVLSIIPNNEGTDSFPALKSTVANFFKGVPERFET